MKCAICKKEVSLKRRISKKTNSESEPLWEYYYECEHCGNIERINDNIYSTNGENLNFNAHCPKCGTSLMQGVMFCPMCGNKIGSTLNSKTKYNVATTIAFIMLISSVIALFVPSVKISVLGIEDTRSAWQLNIIPACIFLILSIVTFLFVYKGQGIIAATLSFFMCVVGIINTVSLEKAIKKLDSYKYIDFSKFVSRQAGCFMLIIAPIILFIDCVVIEIAKQELMRRR